MGTRSTIALETAPGKFRRIYCHWDGYPSHVGYTLANYYDTPEKLNALLDLGDLSSLASSLEKTVAYMRDRKETDCEAQVFTGPLKELRLDCTAYAYCLRIVAGGKIQWDYCEGDDEWKWLPVWGCLPAEQETPIAS